MKLGIIGKSFKQKCQIASHLKDQLRDTGKFWILCQLAYIYLIFDTFSVVWHGLSYVLLVAFPYHETQEVLQIALYTYTRNFRVNDLNKYGSVAG